MWSWDKKHIEPKLKCRIIVSKNDEAREAVIGINSSISGIANIIQSYGWRVEYFEPISPLIDDEDTQTFNIGVLKNANSI